MNPIDHTEEVKRIQEAIDYGIAGTRDESALNKIHKEVNGILMDENLSGRTRQKLPEILTWAEIYFSPRKHQRYNGGIDQVYIWMMTALDSARNLRPPQNLQVEQKTV